MGKAKKQVGKHPARGRRRRHTPLQSPDEYKALDVDAEMVRRYLCLNFNKSIDQLREEFEAENLAFGELSVVSVMLRIFDTGDIYALNALYDRMIGPILRRIHVTGERPFQEWSMEKLVEEKERLNKLNRETIQMIEKERKLVQLVESGEIKPGDYTATPNKEISGSEASTVSGKSYIAK